MKHLAILVVFVAAIVAAIVVFRRQDSTIRFGGRDYINPTGCRKPYRRDLPLRDAGDGILVPSHMPKGLAPVYIYKSRGGCLHAYDLSGGP